MDRYIAKARLGPVLIALLPIPLLLLAWYPNGIVGWKGLVGLASYAGVAYLVAQTVGDIGKGKEPALFVQFGGRPTERALTHLHAINSTTRQLRHAKLQQLVPAIVLPTREDEVVDYDAACDVYRAAIDQLRPRLRHLPLVFAENCHYGFRRNLWALKPWAIALLGVVMFAVQVDLIWRYAKEPDSITAIKPIVFVACALLVLFWSLAIRPMWVKRAADLYSNRFLEGLDGLDVELTSPRLQ